MGGGPLSPWDSIRWLRVADRPHFEVVADRADAGRQPEHCLGQAAFAVGSDVAAHDGGVALDRDAEAFPAGQGRRARQDPLQDHGTLVADREERPGVKFKDADLIGIPYRLTIGPKGLERGVVELKPRASKEVGELPLDGAVERLGGIVREGLSA